MQPLCWGHLRANWADRMLQTDFLRPDAMPIPLEQTLFLLMSLMNCESYVKLIKLNVLIYDNSHSQVM